MSSKKKVITIAVTTVALSLGSIGMATASNSKNSVKIKSSVSHGIRKASNVNFRGSGIGGPNSELAAVLAGLVTKGTLTQAQADAINAAIAAAEAAHQNQGDADRAATQTLIATTLGIDVATLNSRLAAGDSLATIAGAKTNALIAALVADETKEIDAAVTAGKITAAQATTLKANLTAQITARVNGAGMGGGRGHMGGARGHHKGMGSPFGGGMTSVTPNPQG